MKFQEFYEDSKLKIYIDLDGVLTNWLGAFEKISPDKTMDDWKEEGKESEAWDLIHDASPEFWSEMEWTDDGEKLWDFVSKLDPTILSSPGTENVDEVVDAKKVWIDREISKDVPRIIEKEKQVYANDKSVLIDDDEGNIKRWKDKGGIGILHKNADNTISQLKEILELDENLDAKYDSKSKPVGKKWSSKKFFNTKKLNKRSQVFDFI